MRKTILMLLLTILAIAAISCGNNKNKDAAAVEKSVAVTVSEVKNDNIIIRKTYTGTVEGLKQANIYASIPEAVVDLPIPKGSRVESGQPVIILDKNGPASHYTQAYAQFIDAKDNFEKMGMLFQQGAISEQTFNSIRTGFEIAQANFESARQQVELTSPVSGVLTDLAVNIGDYVPVGVPLATIAQIDIMRTTIFVESRGAAHIRRGQVAKILVDISGQDSNEFEGNVAEVSASADPATRMFRVELRFNNTGGRARPGMFARAIVEVMELNNVMVVPKEAVFSVEGVFKVFIIEGDRAREKSISTGESSGDLIQVVSGLNIGEKVITLGRSSVVDGSLVNIASEPGPPAIQ
jgi:RND family efflux transporter MFP subunit